MTPVPSAARRHSRTKRLDLTREIGRCDRLFDTSQRYVSVPGGDLGLARHKQCGNAAAVEPGGRIRSGRAIGQIDIHQRRIELKRSEKLAREPALVCPASSIICST